MRQRRGWRREDADEAALVLRDPTAPVLHNTAALVPRNQKATVTPALRAGETACG